MSRKEHNFLPTEEFIRQYIQAWKDGESMATFAQRIGNEYNTVFARIRRYKRLGINLPVLKREKKSATINVDELNEFIGELL